MDWMKKITFIFSSPFIILMITLVLVVMFGVMDQQTDKVTQAVSKSGNTVASSFQIATIEGEFGKGSKTELKGRIDDRCNINEPGFRGSDDFWIVTEKLQKAGNKDCISLGGLIEDDVYTEMSEEETRKLLNQLIIKTPLYSPETKKQFFVYTGDLYR